MRHTRGLWLGVALAGGLALQAAAPARADQADPALIARGKYLADAGDCVACHTASGGKPFAGGDIMNTPFGGIYPPNITPDVKTGIGSWSDDDFYRAMHEGTGKRGENLYPVFPYPWFTKVTRDDAMAIKAYIFSVPPVNAPDKGNTFPFPFNIRTSLDGWKLLFLHEGTFKPDPKASDEVNRGAYLVEGLGHCGECHTKLNPAGAPELSKSLAGGQVDGWFAPNITSDVRDGIGGWSIDELASFLKNGEAKGHGVVLGPMAQVVHDSLSQLNDADIHAIAAYLKSVPSKPDAVQGGAVADTGDKPGAQVYLSNCASCHQLNGKGVDGQIPALAGNGAVMAQGPQDVIRAMLGGLSAKGGYGPMPAIGADLTDQQVAGVTNYVRTEWGNTAPAQADGGMVGGLRAKTITAFVGNGTGCGPLPGNDVTSDVAKSQVPTMLKGISDANMLSQIAQIVAQTKTLAPKAATDDLVNGLTAAYCPVVADTPNLNNDQRRWRLQRFAQLVYGRLTTGKPDQAD
jgi:mono/diheme cytochrome c family protein